MYQLDKSGSSLNCRLYTLSSQQPSYLNLRQTHFSCVITMINKKRKRRRRRRRRGRGGEEEVVEEVVRRTRRRRRWWRKGGVSEVAQAEGRKEVESAAETDYPYN